MKLYLSAATLGLAILLIAHGVNDDRTFVIAIGAALAGIHTVLLSQAVRARQ